MLVSIVEWLAPFFPLYRASQDAGIWFIMLDQQRVPNPFQAIHDRLER